MSIRTLLLAGVLASIHLVCPTARAETYDTCRGFITSLPVVITSQGTWCMRQDLSTSMSSGAAITVAANNVTIDCNDFKLGGLAAGAATQAVGISSGEQQNVTVRRCTVRGFRDGVSLAGIAGGGHVVEDNRLDNNTRVGAYVAGHDSVVRRNLVRDTGGSSTNPGMAVGIWTAGNVDILDNTVAGVAAQGDPDGNSYGIYSEASQASTIGGNRIRDVVGAGAGTTVGLRVSLHGWVYVTGNHLVGNGIGFGLGCDNANARARDNFVHGHAVSGAMCFDAGGNDF